MALARYELTAQDEAGNVIPSASVEVRRERDGAIVSLYSDRLGATPVGNPVTTDSDGQVGFHVVGGAYQITVTKDSFSDVKRYVGIGLAQESDSLLTGAAFSFSTSTTDADPGLGNIRFNNATLGSVTTIYVDNASAQGATISSWLDTFDDGGTSTDRGTLTLMTADATGLMIARVTGSVVDGTGYRKISVTPLTTAGSFANDATVNVFFTRSPLDAVQAGYRFTFDSATAMADPGAGDFRLNNATLSSVTAMAIDDTSAETGNPDVSAAVLAWDDSTNSIRGTVIIKKVSAPQNFAIYDITGASTDNSGWTQLALTYVVHSGSFSDTDICTIEFIRAGNVGTNGTNGVQPGIPFTFSTTTSMADPGAGTLRLNNATLSSVTAAAVDDTSAASGNPDVSTFVLSWDDSTQTANRGYILIKDVSAPQNFAVYQISGASTDNSGWTQLALTYVTHAGSFSNGATLSVEFVRSADNYTLATASETVEGGVEMATDAEIRSAATGAKAVMAADLESAAAAVSLSDAATIAVDWDTGINFEVTLTASRILGNPTNGQPGTFRTVYVIGNDATDRTLTFGNQYLGEVPTITDIDSGRAYLLSIFCRSSSHFVVSSKKALGT